jgi:hypothetical protein
MAAKEVKFVGDARDRMSCRCGARNAWPKGPLLDKSFGVPRVTKDGVTVAKEIELENKFENMGAQMVRDPMFTAIRRASSLVSNFPADLPPRFVLVLNIRERLSVVVADDPPRKRGAF